MMKAAPAPSFVMVEPKFRLECLIIPLDSPAQLGPVDQVDQGGRRRRGRAAVRGRLLVGCRALDQQPLARMRFGPPVVAMGGADPHRGEAPAQVTPAARALT